MAKRTKYVSSDERVKDIIKEIDNSEIIRVISGDKEELFNKLQKNEIFSLFIYEKGFTDGIELFVTRLKEALTEHIEPTDIHDESELDLNSDVVWDTIDTVKEAFNV